MPALRPLIVYPLLGVAVAGLATAVALYLRSAAGDGPSSTRALLLPEPRVVPELALVDHHGKPFGNDRLRGRWSLLLFGYTRCPDVCPVTLAAVRAAWPRLTGAGEQAVQMLFVSVDPGHDTPEALAHFLAPFPRGFIGLTGDATRIEAVARALGVATAAGGHGGHEAHGGQLLVIGPDVRVRAILAPPADPQLIAGLLTALRRGG